MTFECAKAENCFSDAETWEYRVPAEIDALRPALEKAAFETSVDVRFRHPYLIARFASGVRVRAVLGTRVLRVSFPTEAIETARRDFEDWLGGLAWNGNA